jgi:hypothetical protein
MPKTPKRTADAEEARRFVGGDTSFSAATRPSRNRANDPLSAVRASQRWSRRRSLHRRRPRSRFPRAKQVSHPAGETMLLGI